MKTFAQRSLFLGLFSVLAVALAGPVDAANIQIGDSREKVLKVLGHPQGQMAVGGGLLLLYQRGTVTIQKGEVTGTTIVPEAEYQAERDRKQREEAARKAAGAVARKKRIAQGTVVRRRQLADDKFLAKPAAARLAYWRGFQKKYPEVSVADKIKPLAEEVEGAQKVSRKKVVKDRIAKIEKEEIAAAHKGSQMQYQYGGQRKRRTARIKLKQLKAELAKLKAELKTL